MVFDVAWYICTCHLCQLRQKHLVHIPPVVQPPALLFAKVYIDVMHMPRLQGFKYLIQVQNSLSYYPKYCTLRKEDVRSIGK